jgi:hypothetical protein
MKIIHLPTPVGGGAWGVAAGERELGLQSEVLILYDSWLNYPADRIIFKTHPNSYFEKLTNLAVRIKEVTNIRNNYDIFHFNFGTSLIDHPSIGLPLADLPFYKKKGKIVVTYNGCDARQKYPTMKRVEIAACHNINCYNGMCNSGKLDQERQLRIKKFDKYADAIFAFNPDLLHFLPERAKFLPYAVASWYDIKTLPFKGIDKRLKIVHAPTNRAAKGSDIIIEALNKLEENYGDIIDIILVENIPHKEAIAIYEQADLIIDQILIGWYGGFAVEALKMGKPVMVFIREEDLKFIPAEMAEQCNQAFINANPLNIYEKLCSIAENPGILENYRNAGLEYVNKWHDPLFVANITKTAYES